MLTRVRYAAAALAIAVPAVVCAQQRPPGVQSTSGEAARIGDRVITIQELDDAWKKDEPAEHSKAIQMLYEGRKGALDRMIADLLVAQAAKAKGVSPEQFLKDETARRVTPVTDDAVTAFYEQNRAQMQNRPLEQMRAMVRSYLEQQQAGAARASLIADLRKAGPAIRVAIEPPRQDVPVVATDAARGAAKAGVTVVEYSDYQ